MKIPCVIYARVSTNIQDTESQIRDLQKWAKYSDFEVKEIFKENITGYDKVEKRPDYERMKEYIKTHKIKQVLTYELSRLGRTAQQTLTEIKYFTNEGVNVYFKKDNLNTISNSGINQLILTILSGIAEMEGITLKERTKRGRMISADKGKRVGFSKIPLGYAIDQNGFIIINEEDAELVRTMYKAVASGLSAGRIAKDLNFKGIPTYQQKNKKTKILRNNIITTPRWNPKTIKNIIKNTRYKGYRNYGGDTFKVPRIVTDEIWEEANLKLNEHIGYLSRTKYDYLFKSKITCGQCGYTLKSLRKYSKKGENKKHRDVLYYTCQSYLHTGINCDCGRFRSEVFDDYLYKILFERGRGIQTVIDKERSKSKITELRKKIEYWKGEIDTLKQEQDKITKVFIKGRISEEKYDSEYGILLIRINDANSEISRFKKILSNIETPKDYNIIEKYYLNADFATKREFVEQNVQRIKAYKVEKVEFDLSNIAVPEMDWNDDKIPVKITRFKEPKKNEVIWYVELWSFDEIDPIVTLISSASGTNFTNSKLQFRKESRSISFDLNLENNNY